MQCMLQIDTVIQYEGAQTMWKKHTNRLKQHTPRKIDPSPLRFHEVRQVRRPHGPGLQPPRASSRGGTRGDREGQSISLGWWFQTVFFHTWYMFFFNLSLGWLNRLFFVSWKHQPVTSSTLWDSNPETTTFRHPLQLIVVGIRKYHFGGFSPSWFEFRVIQVLCFLGWIL